MELNRCSPGKTRDECGICYDPNFRIIEIEKNIKNENGTLYKTNCCPNTQKGINGEEPDCDGICGGENTIPEGNCSCNKCIDSDKNVIYNIENGMKRNISSKDECESIVKWIDASSNGICIDPSNNILNADQEQCKNESSNNIWFDVSNNGICINTKNNQILDIDDKINCENNVKFIEGVLDACGKCGGSYKVKPNSNIPGEECECNTKCINKLGKTIDNIDNEVDCKKNNPKNTFIVDKPLIVDETGICGGNNIRNQCNEVVDKTDFDLKVKSNIINEDGSDPQTNCCKSTGLSSNGEKPDECGICGGTGIKEGKCDCDDNEYDECGICGGTGIKFGECSCGICKDSEGNQIMNIQTEEECNGIWTPAKKINKCGECGDDLSGNQCDCSGNEYDFCGVCGGTTLTDPALSATKQGDICDCDNNTLDFCGICGGANLVDPSLPTKLDANGNPIPKTTGDVCSCNSICKDNNGNKVLDSTNNEINNENNCIINNNIWYEPHDGMCLDQNNNEIMFIDSEDDCTDGNKWIKKTDVGNCMSSSGDELNIDTEEKCIENNNIWQDGDIIDECGVCGGNMYMDENGLYPNEMCDCSGNKLDACGNCGGNQLKHPSETAKNQGDICDCDGNKLDECGVCGGEGIDMDTKCCPNGKGPNGEDKICGICGSDGEDSTNKCCYTPIFTDIQKVKYDQLKSKNNRSEDDERELKMLQPLKDHEDKALKEIEKGSHMYKRCDNSEAICYNIERNDNPHCVDKNNDKIDNLTNENDCTVKNNIFLYGIDEDICINREGKPSSENDEQSCKENNHHFLKAQESLCIDSDGNKLDIDEKDKCIENNNRWILGDRKNDCGICTQDEGKDKNGCCTVGYDENNDPILQSSDGRSPNACGKCLTQNEYDELTKGTILGDVCMNQDNIVLQDITSEEDCKGSNRWIKGGVDNFNCCATILLENGTLDFNINSKGTSDDNPFVDFSKNEATIIVRENEFREIRLNKRIDLTEYDIKEGDQFIVKDSIATNDAIEGDYDKEWLNTINRKNQNEYVIGDLSNIDITNTHIIPIKISLKQENLNLVNNTINQCLIKIENKEIKKNIIKVYIDNYIKNHFDENDEKFKSIEDIKELIYNQTIEKIEQEDNTEDVYILDNDGSITKIHSPNEYLRENALLINNTNLDSFFPPDNIILKESSCLMKDNNNVYLIDSDNSRHTIDNFNNNGIKSCKHKALFNENVTNMYHESIFDKETDGFSQDDSKNACAKRGCLDSGNKCVNDNGQIDNQISKLESEIEQLDNNINEFNVELRNQENVKNSTNTTLIQRNTAGDRITVLQEKIPSLVNEKRIKENKLIILKQYGNDETCYSGNNNTNKLIIGGMDKLSTDNCFDKNGNHVNINNENDCKNDGHDWKPKMEGCNNRQPYKLQTGKIIKRNHVLKSIKIDKLINSDLVKENSTLNIVINSNQDKPEPLTLDEKRKKIKSMSSKKIKNYVGNKNINTLNEIEIKDLLNKENINESGFQNIDTNLKPSSNNVLNPNTFFQGNYMIKNIDIYNINVKPKYFTEIPNKISDINYSKINILHGTNGEIKDFCGVCGGSNTEEPTGTKEGEVCSCSKKDGVQRIDECGVCGGTGADENGCCENTGLSPDGNAPDECGVCRGEGRDKVNKCCPKGRNIAPNNIKKIVPYTEIGSGVCEFKNRIIGEDKNGKNTDEYDIYKEIDCSTKCYDTENCKSFSYNHNDSKCILYDKVCNNPYSKDGWKTFENNEEFSPFYQATIADPAKLDKNILNSIQYTDNEWWIGNHFTCVAKGNENDDCDPTKLVCDSNNKVGNIDHQIKMIQEAANHGECIDSNGNKLEDINDKDTCLQDSTNKWNKLLIHPSCPDKSQIRSPDGEFADQCGTCLTKYERKSAVLSGNIFENGLDKSYCCPMTGKNPDGEGKDPNCNICGGNITIEAPIPVIKETRVFNNQDNNKSIDFKKLIESTSNGMICLVFIKNTDWIEESGYQALNILGLPIHDENNEKIIIESNKQLALISIKGPSEFLTKYKYNTISNLDATMQFYFKNSYTYRINNKGFKSKKANGNQFENITSSHSDGINIAIIDPGFDNTCCYRKIMDDEPNEIDEKDIVNCKDSSGKDIKCVNTKHDKYGKKMNSCGKCGGPRMDIDSIMHGLLNIDETKGTLISDDDYRKIITTGDQVYLNKIVEKYNEDTDMKDEITITDIQNMNIDNQKYDYAKILNIAAKLYKKNKVNTSINSTDCIYYLRTQPFFRMGGYCSDNQYKNESDCKQSTISVKVENQPYFNGEYTRSGDKWYKDGNKSATSPVIQYVDKNSYFVSNQRPWINNKSDEKIGAWILSVNNRKIYGYLTNETSIPFGTWSNIYEVNEETKEDASGNKTTIYKKLSKNILKSVDYRFIDRNSELGNGKAGVGDPTKETSYVYIKPVNIWKTNNDICNDAKILYYNTNAENSSHQSNDIFFSDKKWRYKLWNKYSEPEEDNNLSKLVWYKENFLNNHNKPDKNGLLEMSDISGNNGTFDMSKIDVSGNYSCVIFTNILLKNDEQINNTFNTFSNRLLVIDYNIIDVNPFILKKGWHRVEIVFSSNSRLNKIELGWNPYELRHMVDMNPSIYQNVGEKPLHMFYKDNGKTCNNNYQCKSKFCGYNTNNENDKMCCIENDSAMCINKKNNESCSEDIQCQSGVCCKGLCRSTSETDCSIDSYYDKNTCHCVDKKDNKELCSSDDECIFGTCLPSYEGGSNVCFSGKSCDGNNENCYGGNRELNTYNPYDANQTYENGDLCVYDEQCNIDQSGWAECKLSEDNKKRCINSIDISEDKISKLVTTLKAGHENDEAGYQEAVDTINDLLIRGNTNIENRLRDENIIIERTENNKKINIINNRDYISANANNYVEGNKKGEIFHTAYNERYSIGWNSVTEHQYALFINILLHKNKEQILDENSDLGEQADDLLQELIRNKNLPINTIQDLYPYDTLIKLVNFTNTNSITDSVYTNNIQITVNEDKKVSDENDYIRNQNESDEYNNQSSNEFSSIENKVDNNRFINSVIQN